MIANLPPVADEERQAHEKKKVVALAKFAAWLRYLRRKGIA